MFELVPESIAEVRERASSYERWRWSAAVDVLIYGTGFRATETVHRRSPWWGRAGWKFTTPGRKRMTAYLWRYRQRLPNFFILLGPNTGLGPQFCRPHDRSPGPLHDQVFEAHASPQAADPWRFVLRRNKVLSMRISTTESGTVLAIGRCHSCIKIIRPAKITTLCRFRPRLLSPHPSVSASDYELKI